MSTLFHYHGGNIHYLQRVGFNRYGHPKYMCPVCKRVITG